MTGGYSCLVCGNALQLMYDDMFDDRYGCPGRHSLLKCPGCGQIETQPGVEESDLSALYSVYYPRREIDLSNLERKLSWKDRALSGFSRWLRGETNQGHYRATNGMRVLDYGCGDGTSLLELRSLGAEAYGIEADQNVQVVAKHFGLKLHVGSLSENPFPGVTFDLITLNQVIEHIPRPAELLMELRKRLSSDGRVILSFPNSNSVFRYLTGRRWINWHVPYHLHHFCRKSFSLLCTSAGYKVLSGKTVTPNVWTLMQLQTCVLPLRIVEGIPNPLWTKASDKQSSEGEADGTSERGKLRRFLRTGLKTGLRTAVMMVITAVNRTIDCLGMGDSLVVVIESERIT